MMKGKNITKIQEKMKNLKDLLENLRREYYLNLGIELEKLLSGDVSLDEVHKKIKEIKQNFGMN